MPKTLKSMEKTLGQEYEGMERASFLRDNCDAVEELGYVKPLPHETIEELKDQLVENSIEMQNLKDEKEAYDKDFKDKIKPLKEIHKDVTVKLKEKSEFVSENCFKFIDQDKREVGYYNDEGVLVYQRPARPDEMQGTVFQALRKTGTGN